MTNAQAVEDYGCITFEEHSLHRSCASWAGDSQIRALGDARELRRLDGASQPRPSSQR